ncbi:MAG: sugar phosphate isomerase/epimerase [Clostridia bacterium]|nr:sugar phosphate isomerase/epimerase [Clostridia bacterium]
MRETPMVLSTTTTILSRWDDVPPRENLLKSMRLCAKAGFEHLDLHFGTQGQEGFPLAMDGWEIWVDEVAEEAFRLHVTFRQAHAFHYRTRESTAPLDNRPWYEERMRRSVLAAERLGVKWLVQHPSDFDADPTYDFEKARAYNIAYWTPFVELASRHHVGIAFENLYASGHHQRYCSEVDELIDLIDAFKGAPVGACWDTGHAAVAGQDQPAAIRKLGRRLHALHIHDNHKQPKGDEHLMPYCGMLDWDGIYRALADVAYEDNFSFEIKHATRDLPPELCEGMLSFMRQLGQYMVDRVVAERGPHA